MSVPKQITSGELIHRFRKRDEWGPGEWDADLNRIVDAVVAETRADALAAIETARRDGYEKGRSDSDMNYRSVLQALRIRYHAMGRRPEECYEMSLIDEVLVPTEPPTGDENE